jgi:copper chaperone CopZ
MKKILFLSLLTLLTTLAFAQVDKFSVKVSGLGCPYCAYGLEKKFANVPGIQDIHISMEDGVMTYTVPATNAMTQQDVLARVKKAGYTVTQMDILRADGTGEAMDVQGTAPAMEGESCTAKQARKVVRETFAVNGNCGMCKSRIEAAAKSVQGVSAASWDATSQKLTVRFKPNEATLGDIHAAVAKAGHDTALSKADNTTYAALPACCLYDRH